MPIRATTPRLILLVSLASLLVFGPGAARCDDAVTVTGWLSVIWGDPPPETGGGGRQIFRLTDDAGRTTELRFDAAFRGAISKWAGQRVAVTRTLDKRGVPGEVVAMAPLKSAAEALSVSGSQPWISLLCKFSDIGDTRQPHSFFDDMYDNAPGCLDHYWRELSYDTIDVVGSTAAGWYNLPHAQTYYVPTPGSGCFGTQEERADLSALFDDCTAVADLMGVDFANGGTPFQGINLMFNDELDGCAWGGGRWATLDGISKVWRVTWEPPWGYANEGVIAHEMGHGFGLPHSNNSDEDGSPYDSPWDVMSSAGGYAVWDSTYGYLGKHTIAYHKDMLGWIPAGEIFEATGGIYTITIDHLALATTGNYRMARLPIGDGSTYYTVEVRDLVGNYDGALPGNAVIIHHVDPTRPEDAWLVDADDPPASYSNNEGVMWRVGETFVDAANAIAVEVLAATANGFMVEIAVLLFADDFEAGDTSAWSSKTGGS